MTSTQDVVFLLEMDMGSLFTPHENRMNPR